MFESGLDGIWRQKPIQRRVLTVARIPHRSVSFSPVKRYSILRYQHIVSNGLLFASPLLLPMIRKLGNHLGKKIIFGFDRYLLPELDDYHRVLGTYGQTVPAGDFDNLHYLTSAQRVCEAVQDSSDRVGVLVCSTGIGMSIAANKFRGIYAVRCVASEDGSLSRTINNANVLCLASRLGLANNKNIIDEFMTTSYEGRKLEQLACIAEMELESRPAPRVASLSVANLSRKSA